MKREAVRTGSVWRDIDGRTWTVTRRWIGAGRFPLVSMVCTSTGVVISIGETWMQERFEVAV